MTNDTKRPVAAALTARDEHALPDDPTPPIFDVAEKDLPCPHDDLLSVDDDGNVLPGEDDDPNDNGDIALADLAEAVPDLPLDADIDPDADPRPPGSS